MKCIICTNGISGEYWTFENRGTVCNQCHDHLPGCELCSFPTQETAAVSSGTQMVALCSLCWQQTDNCLACGCKIIGKYWTFEEHGTVCNHCHDHLPGCELCSFPTQETLAVSNGTQTVVLCSLCRLRTSDCQVCGCKIIGKYWTFEERGTVCNHCHESVPSCEGCGLPTHEVAATLNGTQLMPLCVLCSNENENCYICGYRIPSRYFEYEEHGKACSFCKEHAEKCDFCSAPVPENTYRYSDGRFSCNKCRETAVLDEAVLDSLDHRARKFMSNYFGMHLRRSINCPMLLVTATELAFWRNEEYVRDKDETRNSGLFSTNSKISKMGSKVVSETHEICIFIEDGHPYSQTYSTVVHELTHLWQFDHFPRGGKKVPEILVEGHAEWVAWHALKDAGDDQLAKASTENSNPIYGGGLRMMIEVEQSRGFEGAKEEILKAAKEKRKPRPL